MTRAQYWFLQLSNLAVGGTGLVYGWMIWFAVPVDEFAVVNHPLQPSLQHAHILTAPLLVFAVGLIWSTHALRHYRRPTRSRRRAGITLMVSLFPMIFSGYALQVSSDVFWTEMWTWLHVGTSCVWILTVLIHPLRSRLRIGSA